LQYLHYSGILCSQVTSKWSRYSCTRYLLLVLCVLVLTGTLSSCSKIPSLLLGGGGPNVAANVQAGKTNSQTVGTTNNVDQKLIRPTARNIKQSNDTNKIQTDQVDNIVVNEVPIWVILLLIMGWLLPSPNEIGRGFFKLIGREKK